MATAGAEVREGVARVFLGRELRERGPGGFAAGSRRVLVARDAVVLGTLAVRATGPGA